MILTKDNNTNEYWYRGMDRGSAYYFTIGAVNENGVSSESEIVKVD